MQNLHSPVRLRSAPPSLVARTSSGLVLGGAAGLFLALFDLAGSLPWVARWETRGELALELALLLPSAFGLLGALLGAAGALGARPVARLAARLARERDFGSRVSEDAQPAADAQRAALHRRRLWPLPYLLVAAPGCIAVGHLLFTGGSASRLPMRGLLEPVAMLVLLAAVYLALRFGSFLRERARQGGAKRSALVALGLLVVAGVLARVDQAVLPNLYDYLHAVVTIVTWLVVGLAIACAAQTGPLARVPIAARPRGLAALVAVCVASFAIGLVALDAPDVRVALFDAHASNSRTLMMSLEPLACGTRRARADTVERARRARARRRVLASGVGLPTWEDAHVLLVTIDALRADHLGAYGYARPTSPALDALAERSVLFERAYAQAPHSSYSLSSLMASEYLHETVEIGSPLPDETLPRAMARAGRETVALFPLGIFHTEGERLARYRDESFGFERTDHRDLDATAKTDAAVDALLRIARAGEPRSFLWVHYFDTHEPYQDTTFGTSDVDRYDSEIRHVDTELERLLASARDILAKDVIVVVTADHGEEFRDHGGVYHGSTLYDEQVRVPLLVHADGLAPRRVAAPVEIVDLAPTLLAMVDAVTPTSMRGDDLRALAAGRVEDVGPAFSGVGRKRMVLVPPFKLIVDLRYDLHELYDLEGDPRERDNLARSSPERLESLEGELFAWLDSLRSAPSAHEEGPRDPRLVALERARLGDRRSANVLIETLEDGDEDAALRASAARVLGELEARGARSALFHRLEDADTDTDRAVARESAIALGRLYDGRAAEALARIVLRDDIDARDRARAAVALARLGDARAVPHLGEAARMAEDRNVGTEAVRRLGLLAGARAFDELVALADGFDTRRQALISLGMIGDPRAYEVLVGALEVDTHASMRDASVQALGHLADPRAIPVLLALAREEPELRMTTESLVRLDAIGRGVLGGLDFAPPADGAATRDGIGACEARAADDIWHFRERTHCRTTADRVVVALAPPGSSSTGGEVLVVIRLERADAAEATAVTLEVGDAPATTLSVDGSWMEHRFTVPANALAPRTDGTVEARVTAPGARLDLDHLLLL